MAPEGVVPLPGEERVPGDWVEVPFTEAEGRSARATFSRPPVTVFPAREGTGSTLERIRSFSACAFICGFAAASNATAPATCGVAIEVPFRYP